MTKAKVANFLKVHFFFSFLNKKANLQGNKY